jgi:D-alanine-D-alanine ligase
MRFHAFVAADSTRNQDLGMMANRMFLTAEAPRRVERAKRFAPLLPEVTVVMGDPRLPDPVKRNASWNAEDFETIARLTAALEELPGYRFRYLDNHASLIADLRKERPGFVLNLCDEGYENDAFRELHVPALLEMLDVPYSGAGPSALGLCYNKSLVRAIATELDVPVPAETYFSADDQAATIPSVFPALIKPCYGDSSIGITKDAVVQSWEQAIAYLSRLREELPGRPILLQEFLTGAEYSVGLVGNPGLGMRVLPVLEVDYSKLDPALPQLLGYESKWEPGSPYWTQIGYREAPLDEDSRRRLVDYSTLLFERLGCRDYARFDFRVGAGGEAKLLEVNPNPGWCWDGKLNIMAGFGGLRYADLLRLVIEAAQERVATQMPGRVQPQEAPVRLVANRR